MMLSSSLVFFFFLELVLDAIIILLSSSSLSFTFSQSHSVIFAADGVVLMCVCDVNPVT